MKIGILSDVHGNLQGLEKCLDFLFAEKVEKIFFLGDFVGYLPEVNEVITKLIEIGAICIIGNHDKMIIDNTEQEAKKGALYNLDYTRKVLSNENRKFLTSLPEIEKREINNIKIEFVHGSPDNHLNGYIYPDSSLEGYAEVIADYIFCGHTHRPFVRKHKNKVFVNVGSCGISRDNSEWYSCCIFDVTSEEVEIYRLKADIERIKSNYQSKIHPSLIEHFETRRQAAYGRLIV